ncbi:MAG: bifunctional DNA primase/polymerase [Halobacteriota archaeon]
MGRERGGVTPAGLDSAMSIQPQGIRTCLKERRQWVLWRRENPKTGKKGKAPYQLNGHHARTDDPTTWASFEQCLEAYRSRKRYDGIGFVFSSDQDIVGVDLDGFRDPATGAVDEQARAIIAVLDSYSEVSPSGRGIHVLLRGRLPGARRRKEDIEVYGAGHYFTVTGNHVEGTPATIEQRQEALTSFYRNVFGD